MAYITDWRDEFSTPFQIKHSTMSSGRVLVYGGRGGLGSVVVSSFKAADWWVLSIDSKANDQADENVLVDINPEASWLGQEKVSKTLLSNR